MQIYLFVFNYLPITNQFTYYKNKKKTTTNHNWTCATSIMKFVYQLWHAATCLLAVTILAGKPVVYYAVCMQIMWVSHARQKH